MRANNFSRTPLDISFSLQDEAAEMVSAPGSRKVLPGHSKPPHSHTTSELSLIEMRQVKAMGFTEGLSYARHLSRPVQPFGEGKSDEPVRTSAFSCRWRAQPVVGRQYMYDIFSSSIARNYTSRMTRKEY